MEEKRELQFPKAHKGVKKLFTAEILKLIGALCVVVGSVAGVMTLGSALSETGTASGLIAGGIGTIVSFVGGLIFPLIALIISLVGLKQASHDEQQFKTAFLLSIIALIVSVASGFLSGLQVGGDIISSIASLIVYALQIIVLIFTIEGIRALADRLGDSAIVEKGRKILFLLTIMFGIAALAQFFGMLFRNSLTMATIAGILALGASVVGVIAYIIYLVFLSKSKKMLGEATVEAAEIEQEA